MNILNWLKRRQDDEDEAEQQDLRVMTPEETSGFFEDYKQSEAYLRYRAIKDGTYSEKFGEE